MGNGLLPSPSYITLPGDGLLSSPFFSSATRGWSVTATRLKFYKEASTAFVQNVEQIEYTTAKKIGGEARKEERRVDEQRHPRTMTTLFTATHSPQQGTRTGNSVWKQPRAEDGPR